MSCLSCQSFRRNLSSIHIIFNSYGNREIFLCLSLIINILSISTPGQIISVLSKCFITFYVFYILKIRGIFHLRIGTVSGIFQPVRYCDIRYFSSGSCIYINGFFFLQSIITCWSSCHYSTCSENYSHSCCKRCCSCFLSVSVHNNLLLYSISLQ